LAGAGMGWLLDVAHGRWSLAFYSMAALALVPSLMMFTLWNAKPKKSKR
jgi:hypothetical protein